MADVAIFDVDGTLVDTNYHHALAWFRAFRRFDLTVPVWRLHRGIGMGGDQFVAHVAGDDIEARYGDDLRAAWTEEFDPLVPEVRPFEGTRLLLADVRRRGFRVVLASSGQKRHVEAFLDLIDGAELAEAWTSSDDAESSKPAPDILQAAMDRVPGSRGVMIGDSVWDCQAAQRLSYPTIGLRTGGYSLDELSQAGADPVFDSLIELRNGLNGTPLASAE
jgi:phosphoglycolate phosphatase-like HAD superfamily hydrolase